MTENKSNKMGSMPIKRLLITMSLPSIFSMLIQAMYNIVDSMYIARLSGDALLAIGLVFPIQMASIAVAVGAAVGTNALIARRLGQKRQDHANQTATTGLLLSLFHGILCAIFGFLVSKAFLQLFTLDTNVVELGTSYLFIVMGFSFASHIQIMAERILQSTGNMVIPMFTQLLGAIINIILDPILIFGYFGMPALGMKGAAIATIVGQFIGMSVMLLIIYRGKHDVKIEFKNFKLETVVVRKIYKIGIPVMIMNAIGSVATTMMNGILASISVAAVNSLSIYFKVQSFVFMPIFGMTQGAMPILAYNFGAKNKERFVKTVKLMFIASFAIMFVGTIIFWVYSEQLIMLFNPDQELLKVGSIALKIISIHFVIAAFGIVITTIFQSMGNGFIAMIMSILRQLVFIVPIAYIFAVYFGLNYVWLSYTIASLLNIIMFAPKCYKTVKQGFS